MTKLESGAMRIVALTHLYPQSGSDRRGVFIRQLYDRLVARGNESAEG